MMDYMSVGVLIIRFQSRIGNLESGHSVNFCLVSLWRIDTIAFQAACLILVKKRVIESHCSCSYVFASRSPLWRDACICSN